MTGYDDFRRREMPASDQDEEDLGDAELLTECLAWPLVAIAMP